jgi:tripartite-type tricarboxylate transporter receptor subunit TctC
MKLVCGAPFGARVSVALIAALALPLTCHGQTYPSGPIRMLVPYPAGGSSDVIMRPLAPALSLRLGQHVVVDNRGGGGGIIAMEIAAKAAPDGYTLVFALSAQVASNVSLFRNLPYDPVRDYAPISLLGAAPYLLEVNAAVPAKSVAEFIALAKAKPGQINYWSSGNGSAPHLSMELLKVMTGIDLVHVPYKGGGPAYPDFIAGRTQSTFTSYGSSIQHVHAGRLHMLAVSTAKRSGALPDLPTVAEGGVPGYDSSVWYALLAPRGTPLAIVERLNREVTAAMTTPDMVERLNALTLEVIASSPQQLVAHIKSEISKWADVVKRSGATID